MPEPAPFHHAVAEGPEDARAVWVRAEDGVRLRLAVWPGGTRGTVLLFPGRTEYVEKYGRTAGEFRALGLSVIAIDWRGQGLAERHLDDRATGHVIEFPDYQLDVAEMLRLARAEGLAEPYFLIAHSMGGCIGLRSLMEDLPVRAAAFTAPMWGIPISGLLRPVAWSLSWASQRMGFGHRYVPGTAPETYVEGAPFEDNVLTTDREMFDYMLRQVSEHPDLALGGPSLHWLFEALMETRALARRPAPEVPCLTWLGGNERVVDTDPIHARMAGWPGGRLELVDRAEHEVLMERPEVRDRVMAETAGFFGLRDAA
ncbi:alpha/beta hydrolase [Psychromarinibacter sp. C21-152]|uniref:Alpha/beta hydrolase n=1 Tax=Psychromarinibacter sediminicola TaxID=3033385 RepID=A0AAE3NTP6_9RHOB|nr:alpha/beta hydrolase [Psychromarinibacter sediminicola]MDF0600377.1 alpha/beta hydrolase [Psychromarinibacter sediminicola]